MLVLVSELRQRQFFVFQLNRSPLIRVLGAQPRLVAPSQLQRYLFPLTQPLFASQLLPLPFEVLYVRFLPISAFQLPLSGALPLQAYPFLPTLLLIWPSHRRRFELVQLLGVQPLRLVAPSPLQPQQLPISGARPQQACLIPPAQLLFASQLLLPLPFEVSGARFQPISTFQLQPQQLLLSVSPLQ